MTGPEPERELIRRVSPFAVPAAIVAYIVAAVFGGENAQAPVIERLELQGNLATLHESCLRFVKRYCDRGTCGPAGGCAGCWRS